jgi:large subunit ribosomal protein L14|uniref:Ribosomal protein L14 n=1 Tax=Halamphora coffeiformis TaxID=1487565 RepID=A0A2R4A3C1_9STRA|nr:ribosomal protein L14 [Halamphora coffeaeformis]AVR57522.1 ribosomal protein L14 [Halamphora coffeaeformis]
MIQLQTILKVADNSGAKTARCIKVLGGFKKRIAKLGDTIVVSIQTLRNKSKKTSKVKKGQVYKALIVRTRLSNTKNTGLCLKFKDNAIILLNKQGNPVGTRILGPLLRTFQKKTFQKFTTLAAGLI